MIKVAPMDHELAIGHEWRIAWVNGVINQVELDRLLASGLPQNATPKLVRPSKLSRLAAHAEMSPPDYARKHSMLSGFRVAAKHGEDLMHGHVQGEPFSRRLGMRTQKQGAYICKECVNDGLKKRQLSWYRREHHLYGVDWCPIHEVALFRITATNPWVALPHHWMEDSEIESAATFAPDERDLGFLRRYAQIAESLLDRATPLDVRALGHLIGGRAQDLGLRTSVNGQKLTISDYIWQNTPKEWLKIHFSHIASKEQPGFITKIDSAVISRTIPAQGHVYGLVLASLFDSSHEALQYLNTCVPVGVIENLKKSLRRNSIFWHGEFWEIYVKHGGLTAKIAESLGMDKTYLQEKMWTLGMPSLHNVGASKPWRALIRLHNGEGFRHSCKLEKTDEKELEELLRTVSPKVVALASKIVGNARRGVEVVSANLPPLRLVCDVHMQSVTPAPNLELIDSLTHTVVCDQGATLQALENMKAA